jgi:uncharacterized protein (TIGR00369 family)
MPHPKFEHYDEGIAKAMMRAHENVTGLPQYLGARLAEYAPGRLVGTMDVRPELLTPFGTLHGGVMAGYVDHILGCGLWAATTEFKLNYLAPVRGGTLTAESTVVSLTRRTAVVRVEVTNGDQLACVAQGTLLVADPPKKS